MILELVVVSCGFLFLFLSFHHHWCFLRATFFAAMDPDGMHLGNDKTAKIFIKNFFTDFKAVLGRGHAIKDFKKCDFEPIRKHLNEQKIIRKAITDEERKANKEDRNQAMYKFGFAIVDGHLEKVGNYNMVSKVAIHFITSARSQRDSKPSFIATRNPLVPFEDAERTQRWEN